MATRCRWPAVVGVEPVRRAGGVSASPQALPRLTASTGRAFPLALPQGESVHADQSRHSGASPPTRSSGGATSTAIPNFSTMCPAPSISSPSGCANSAATKWHRDRQERRRRRHQGPQGRRQARDRPARRHGRAADRGDDQPPLSLDRPRQDARLRPRRPHRDAARRGALSRRDAAISPARRSSSSSPPKKAAPAPRR